MPLVVISRPGEVNRYPIKSGDIRPKGSEIVEAVPIDFGKLKIEPCLLEFSVDDGVWKGEAVNPANCKDVSSDIAKLPRGTRRYLKSHLRFDETATQNRK